MANELQVCRYLRWKSVSRDSDDPEQLATTFAKNQVPYTCLHTCQSWGPDDDLAASENCSAARSCFAARRPVPLAK